MSGLQRLAAWLRRRAFTFVAAAGLLAYFLWTVSSSHDPFDFALNSKHANIFDPGYYNLLGDAFLHGKLHLLVNPAPQLLHLANPYNPAANSAYQLHDASLYHGKYYLYWGPVPALLLYLPFRLLSIGEMPDSLATAIFAFGGTCFAIALFRYLTRRYLPGVPRWMIALATVGIVAGSALPFTLRRTVVYEVAICGGYCLMFAGLYLLTTGVLERPYRLRRLTISSLCFGLAVGCRPTMVLPALLPIVALSWILLRDRPTTRRATLGVAAALAGPLAACGALLATYNVLRFGSISEFGQHYQLSSFDPETRTFGSLSYVPPGAWYYLLARAHITAAFPFFHLPPPPQSYPGALPTGYDGIEGTGGLLTNVPVVTLALVPWLAIRGRRDRALRWLATTLTVLGLALVLVVSYSLWGATMRYEVDFATLLLISSVLTWFALSRARLRVARWAVKVAGSLALVWGIAFGLAVGMTGYYDTLLTNQPGTYAFLERFTAPIGTAIVRAQGEPQVVRVDPLDRLIAAPKAPSLDDLSVGLSSQRTALYVIAPSSGLYRFVAQPAGGVSKPTANLCANSGFESSVRGWVGFSGHEKLTRVTTEHALGSAALRVSIPDADLQGTVYNTTKGQAIRGGTPVMTSVWMKGTAGAALEMQVRIVNTDGTASGSITSFAATGGWQRESATANVTPGKVGDVVQILALRRVAAGPDTFYVDGAQAGPGTIATALRLTTPGAGRERVVPLATIGSGLDVHLGRGLNRITMSTPAGHVTLSDITLTKAPGPTANLCANSGFESSVRGWVGFSGREKLSRVTTEHALGSAALRVSIPDADLQGTVYNTTKGQAIPGGTPVTTSLWMKGTAGAALEMQVRIVNTDGTSSGSITSFAASGGWQRKSATANVTPGKTGDVVQILALRRVASGPDTFYVDGAQAGPGNAPG